MLVPEKPGRADNSQVATVSLFLFGEVSLLCEERLQTSRGKSSLPSIISFGIPFALVSRVLFRKLI